MSASSSNSYQQIDLIVTRWAASIALVLAVVLPLGFALNAYKNLADDLEFKAQVKASALNDLIANSPKVWVFAENRMQGLLSREPVPLDNELVEVFDLTHNVLVQSGKLPAQPVLRKSVDLFDADTVVGHLAVTGSMRTLLLETLVATLISVLLSLSVFLVIRELPLRALRKATDALIDEKDRAQAMLQSISDAVITSDAQGVLMQVNPAGIRIMGAQSVQQMVGHPVADWITPEYRASYADHHQRVLAGQTLPLEYEVLSLRGERRWLESQDTPLREGGKIVHLAVARDVTERKMAEQEIKSLAFYDPLTGLPNRRLLADRIDQAKADGARTKKYTALLFIDLDKFKAINDSLGHATGDLLLQQVAQRLVSCVREGDTVARVGGDEFVVLLLGLNQDLPDARAQTEAVGKKILTSLNTPYQLGQHTHTNTPSIGITLFNDHQYTNNELIRCADLAMYQAKASGRNTMLFFDPGMLTAAARRDDQS